MTLRCMSGFEGSAKTNEVFSGMAYGAGRTGQCIYSAAASTPYAVETIPGAIVAEGVVGIAIGSNVGIYYNSYPPAVSLRNSAGGAELTLHIEGSTMTLRRGYTDGTALGVAQNAVTSSVWAYYELEFKIHQTAGYARLWINGIKVIDFAGDTQNSSDATPGIADVYLKGWQDTYMGSVSFDDFYLVDIVDATATQGRANNERIGQPKIEALVPNGNGASSQWVGSDGNSVDNYLLVDEIPSNAADYVESSTTGNRDLYEFSNPAIVGPVLAVEVVAVAASPDGGTNPLKIVSRSGAGTVVASAGIVPAATYKGITNGLTTKDPDGALWTTALVSSAQFGVEVG